MKKILLIGRKSDDALATQMSIAGGAGSYKKSSLSYTSRDGEILIKASEKLPSEADSKNYDLILLQFSPLIQSLIDADKECRIIDSVDVSIGKMDVIEFDNEKELVEIHHSDPIRWIRKNHETPIIIIASRKLYRKSIVAGIEAGASHFMESPSELTILKALISNILE